MFKRKDDIRTFIVITCVCGLCLIIGFFFAKKDNSENLTYVNDYDVFFSNVSYINNYINNIANNNYNAVYSLLDDKYKENNNITNINVLDIVDNYSTLSSFKASTMKYTQIKDNFIYYIEGKIYENMYEGEIIVDDNFSIVIIEDKNSDSYSLYPITDDNYVKVINKINKINIKNNDYNRIQKSNNISKEQICVIYLSDYMNNIFNNINASYDMLSDDMKKKYDRDKYILYINKNIDILSSTADKCKMDEYDEKRVYTVIDINGNTYRFNEESVMNYNVDINFNNVG